jgi:hypothetical protein
MWRKRVLRVVLVVVGLIFIAGVYPLVTSVRDGWRANKEDSLPMGISLYVTQGVFLLLASRDPLANRGVISPSTCAVLDSLHLLFSQSFETNRVGCHRFGQRIAFNSEKDRPCGLIGIADSTAGLSTPEWLAR